MSYKRLVRRLQKLGPLAGRLVRAACEAAVPDESRLYVVDAKPIPVCKPLRQGRVRLLIEEGAYFGKSSAGWFFGFKFHTLTHHSGALLSALLSPGNWQDGGASVALGCSTGGGVEIGDYGYRGRGRFDAFWDEADLVRVLPSDDGEGHTTVSQVCQRIETVFSQLWSRFTSGRVYARSFAGLWSAIQPILT